MSELLHFKSELENLNFVAIDFETANEMRASACSFGYAVVENGKIVNAGSFLIRPKELRVSFMNERVHGISEADLENAPEFDALWPEIKPLFDKVIVAHNCDFDISVLRKTAELYGIELPNFQYLCSYKLAKVAFSEMLSHKLKDLANHFGFHLNHHNSQSDAEASARIAVKALTSGYEFAFDMKEANLSRKFGQNNILNKKSSAKKKPSPKDFQPNLNEVNAANPLFQKNILFSGVFSSFSREEAFEIAQSQGAITKSGISKNLDFLVAGDNVGPSKLEKATSLSIPIISEKEFLAMLNEVIEYNYNRFDLLKEALQQEGTTMEQLCTILATDPISLQENLHNENQVQTIKAVAHALGIPEAYFWNGLQYKNGKLVENKY